MSDLSDAYWSAEHRRQPYMRQELPVFESLDVPDGMVYVIEDSTVIVNMLTGTQGGLPAGYYVRAVVS